MFKQGRIRWQNVEEKKLKKLKRKLKKEEEEEEDSLVFVNALFNFSFKKGVFFISTQLNFDFFLKPYPFSFEHLQDQFLRPPQILTLISHKPSQIIASHCKIGQR